MQVSRHGGCVAHGVDEVSRHVIDLDRRESETLESLDRAGRPDQLGKRESGGTIPKASEVDAGEHDLTGGPGQPDGRSREHGVCRPAPRAAPDERGCTERTGERAAVLDLHEGAHPFDPVIVLNAPDRADVNGDGVGEFLAPSRNDLDVPRQSGEGVAREIRRTPCHVDAACLRSCLRRSLPRFRHCLVRHAARVDDCHVCVGVHLRYGRR